MIKDIGEGTIRRIDWQELTPVVLLLRIFNTARCLRVLFLSLIGILLTTLFGGVMMIDSKNEFRRPDFIEIVPEQKNNLPADISVWEKIVPKNAKTNYLDPLMTRTSEKPVLFQKDPVKYVIQYSERSVLLPWKFFTKTGGRCFILTQQSWVERFHAAVWFFVTLVIWLWFGGLICRTVALRLTIDQSESFGDLQRFMCRRGLGFFSSLAIILIGVLFCLMVVKICGWLFLVPILNYAMMVIFPIPLLFGFFAVVLLVGLWFGWPLLFAAVSVDGSDGFDAVSRMFSYLYQRILHYFVYWFYCGLLGIFGYFFVSVFVYGLIYVTVNIGNFPVQGSVPTVDVFRQLPIAENSSLPARLIAVWCGVIELLLPAYAFAWFWTSSVAIYLLLRRSVDATPFDEVYRIEKTKPKTVEKIGG
jgi:hypothetical protein